MTPPDPALLRTEFLGLSVRYDDVDLPREDLAAFFAQVSERHGLNRLDLHAEGGATMSGPDGGELSLRPTAATSGGMAHLGITEALERVAVLLGEALARYGVGAIGVDDVTLVATWETEDVAGARRIVTEDILRMDEERAGLIGGDDLAFGLRLWRRLGEGSVDCAIEPMHADPGKLYIRLAYSQPEPVADISGLVAVVEQVHDFLLGPVRSFVVELARR